MAPSHTNDSTAFIEGSGPGSTNQERIGMSCVAILQPSGPKVQNHVNNGKELIEAFEGIFLIQTAQYFLGGTIS